MKVEKVSKSHVKYTFEVTPHEFEHGLDHAFEHVAKDVEIKGFRKGKVPRNIYETKFGVESLYEDALNHVLHHKYHEAQNHKDYVIVGQPKVDVDFKSIKRGEVFEVSFTAPVKPEVTLGTYKGIKVKNREAIVKDEDVTKEVNSLLSKSSELELKEGSLELGDTAIFDFDGYLDGVPFDGGKAENYSLEIGSNQFIPGFEEQMVGMNPNEEKDLNVTFPKEYQAEHLRGKDVVFKVKLHEVKTKKLSELNDEFVLSLKKDGVNTVSELLESVKSDLEKTKKSQAEQDMTQEILTKLLSEVVVEIPEEMIEEEMKHQRENVENQAKQYGLEFDMFLSLSGVTKEDFERQIRFEAESRVKMTLVIEEVAKLEGIHASSEELLSKYEDLAKQYNMPVDEIKKYIKEDQLDQDIALNKAYQFILDSAVKE